MPQPPLAGVRIIECSMLGPAAITTHLADLGAEVIKVESPQGDYVRQMTWPIVEGVSLMHLHINRGKRASCSTCEPTRAWRSSSTSCGTPTSSIEAMRPGGLERRGLGYDHLREVNPRIVFCTISGYGMTGPYKDMPSHGIAYDTWAGLVQPEDDDDGFSAIPEHPSIGINAGPLFGALGMLAGIIRARATGEGCRLEIAQSDAAAAMDWQRSRDLARPTSGPSPRSPATRPTTTSAARPAPPACATACATSSTRRKDGHVLFMASEQEFWKNFCEGVDRADLFERWPGTKYADHAAATSSCAPSCARSSRSRTSAEWIAARRARSTRRSPP